MAKKTISEKIRSKVKGSPKPYVAGDSIRELAEVVCEMGCPRCNPE